MREDTPSRTAAWVAAARGLGRLLPREIRLADDPFGAAFTSLALARMIEEAASDIPPSTSLATALHMIRSPLARMPGLQRWILYMQVRTRVIDDVVRTFALQDNAQLVLLGAGYDCRALRLPELGETRVFEVDHPATQGHKRRVLDKIGYTSPSTYVTWDFETQPMDDLPAALAESGHDPTAPTLTIWEGVTMYLTEPAIEASLAAIRAWSAAGSQLAMTYFARGRLARPTLTTRAIAAVVARVGEPWRWGWVPDELPGYLEERGLVLVDDIALADAARELLPLDLARVVDDADRRFALAATPESIAVIER
ncbi:MAG: SAM-dependent methyltransferase [Deltaproteobacteria bacterium]|nr:SAM-dependent methyltransferase [Deltaproteobacteria bacterium]